MNDPFEPTPVGFHNRMEQKLNELQREKTPAHSHRWVAVVAVCLVLLCGTALALNHFGVLYFLTDRQDMPDPVDEAAIAAPISQSCNSKRFTAKLQDAYWDGEVLSLSVSVQPNADYAFYMATELGADGENFDTIWLGIGNGGQPIEEWKNGREGLELLLPELKLGDEAINWSWDWVLDGNGRTIMVAGHADDLTQGADLTLTLESVLENSGETEHAALTVHLPPMKKGEPKE